MDFRSDKPPSYEEVALGPAAVITPVDEPSTSALATELAEETHAPASGEPKESDKHKRSPPSYDAATCLPTYKESQKEREDEARQEAVNALFFLNIDEDEPYIDGMRVGNDCYFVLAFLVGFFFNWFGLFVGYIIIFNWGGRYGSLCGFGLSSIKWLIFIRFSDCCGNYFINSHDIIWWICCAVALLLFLKGVISWARVRKLRDNPPVDDE